MHVSVFENHKVQTKVIQRWTQHVTIRLKTQGMLVKDNVIQIKLVCSKRVTKTPCGSEAGPVIGLP